MVKLDNFGNYIWGRTIGNAGTELANSIIYDTDGYIYISGIFSGLVNFDSGVTNTSLNSVGFGDLFVQKLDTNGNHIWAKSFHGQGTDIGASLALDTYGDLIVCGTVSDTTWFDPPYTDSLLPQAYPYDDAFVIKMSGTNGNVLWSKTLGGSKNVVANTVAVDYDDNILVSGSFQDTCDLNPSDTLEFLVTEYADRSAFVLKLTNWGDFIWGKTMVGTGGTSSGQLGGVGLSLAISTNNDVYVGGIYSDSVDFDPGPGISNLYAINPSGTTTLNSFVLKLNTYGEFKWVNSIERFYTNDIILDIAIDENDYLYVTGDCNDGAVFHTDYDTVTLNFENIRDIFCIKTDSLGHYLWDLSFGSVHADWAGDVEVGNNAEIYLGGTFGQYNTIQGTADLNPSTNQDLVTLQGSSDIYVIKLNQCDDSLNSAPTLLQTTLPDIYDECSIELTKPMAYHICAGVVEGKTADSIYVYSVQGSYSVEWFFDDGYGNTISQFQNVTIADTTKPVPIQNSLPTIIANCDTSVIAPFAEDNCIGLIEATTQDAIAFSNQGTYTISWLFDDQHGNQFIQNQTVIINDSIPPSPDVLILASIYSQCPPVTLSAPTATDDCDGNITATTNQPIIYSDQGTFSVIWEFQDNTGNIIFQTQDLEIELLDSTVVIVGDTLYSNANGSYIYQWLNCSTGGPVIGANQNYFVPGNNDSYSVNVYNGSCSVFSNCISVVSSEIVTIQTILEEIQLTPNPVVDVLSINCPLSFIGSKINIVDAIGRNIRSEQIIDSQYSQIDVSDLKSGVYFIHLDNGNQKSFVKY